MSKGERYGKYGGSKAWGQAHHLHEKDWGTKRHKGKVEDHSWSFRNPKTGAITWLHGSSFEEVQRQANVLGLVRTRRRGFKGMDGE